MKTQERATEAKKGEKRGGRRKKGKGEREVGVGGR